MCQQCVDNVKKYFPKLPKNKYGDLLMSATSFPMGDAKQIERQLRDLNKRGIRTLRAASAYAADQMDRAMKQRDR